MFAKLLLVLVDGLTATWFNFLVMFSDVIA